MTLHSLEIEGTKVRTTCVANSDEDTINIEQFGYFTGEEVSINLSFSDLAEIVNWANRNMGALVLAPKEKAPEPSIENDPVNLEWVISEWHLESDVVERLGVRFITVDAAKALMNRED